MRAVTPRLDCASARARCPSADPSARSWVTAPASSDWALNESERSRAVKFFRDGSEVFHVRTNDDRFAEIGRLQDVVAAALCQRAPHEDDIGYVKERSQFADGIEQQDSGQGQRLERTYAA